MLLLRRLPRSTLFPYTTLFRSVVIQGPNVVPGYENNPEANAKSFTNGWFRTGDQGFLDSDSYLMLTGRLKELINRGGEDRKSTRLNSSHRCISYAVFCLKKKNQ